jgi:hypothetical protein
MSFYTFLSKRSPTPKLARRGLETLAAALLAALAAWPWSKPAPSAGLRAATAAAYDCPKVQLERKSDSLTALRVLEAEIPQGYTLYALAAESRSPEPATWKQVSADTQSAEPSYLAPLGQGWLYLVALPAAWPDWDAIALPSEEGGDAKGAGYVHGPAPRWLEPDRLPGLPAAARVCSLEW